MTLEEKAQMYECYKNDSYENFLSRLGENYATITVKRS